jgi:hypothetical protein
MDSQGLIDLLMLIGMIASSRKVPTRGIELERGVTPRLPPQL